jgi:hypothetical protein
MTLGKEDLLTLLSDLKKCPFSDNKVDYVEEAIKNFPEVNSWFLKDYVTVKGLISESIEIVDQLDWFNATQPSGSNEVINSWDERYDKFCNEVLHRLEVWEKYYDLYCKTSSFRNREPKSFIEFADKGGICILDKDELKILGSDLSMRLEESLLVKNLVNDKDCLLEGIRKDTNGVLKVYLSDGSFNDLSGVIPYLVPLKEIYEYHLVNGKKKLLFNLFVNGLQKNVRHFSSKEKEMEYYNNLLLNTRAGRNFAVTYRIDINGLIDRGLALDGTNYYFKE